MYSRRINEENVNLIQNQIDMKNYYTPHYGTSTEAKSVINDMDHFPYTRFFRGVYNSDVPIVFEREAGWRPQINSCYTGINNCQEEISYPNHCFESACSVVYPCNPEYLKKISDRDALNVQLNKSCIVKYR